MAAVTDLAEHWPQEPTTGPEAAILPLPTRHSTGGFLIEGLQETATLEGIAEIAGARIHYTAEIPHEVTDPFGAIYVPGFGGIEESYALLRHETAARGKVSVTLQPPRAQHWRKAWHPAHALHPERLPSQAVWGVIRDLEGKLPIERWDAFLHSWGGVAGANAALHRPDYFRSLVFKASTGLSGDWPWSYVPRLAPFLRDEVVRGVRSGELRQFENEVQVAISGIYYALRCPRRTGSEMLAAGFICLRNALPQLKQFGIKLGMTGFAADKLVPFQRAIDRSGHLMNVVSVHPDATAGHTAPQAKAAQVAVHNLQILHQLHAA